MVQKDNFCSIKNFTKQCFQQYIVAWGAFEQGTSPLPEAATQRAAPPLRADAGRHWALQKAMCAQRVFPG